MVLSYPTWLTEVHIGVIRMPTEAGGVRASGSIAPTQAHRMAVGAAGHFMHLVTIQDPIGDPKLPSPQGYSTVVNPEGLGDLPHRTLPDENGDVYTTLFLLNQQHAVGLTLGWGAVVHLVLGFEHFTLFSQDCYS